jgi:hypothetical protein
MKDVMTIFSHDPGLFIDLFQADRTFVVLINLYGWHRVILQGTHRCRIATSQHATSQKAMQHVSNAQEAHHQIHLANRTTAKTPCLEMCQYNKYVNKINK